jgi:hypothetical protein
VGERRILSLKSTVGGVGMNQEHSSSTKEILKEVDEMDLETLELRIREVEGDVADISMQLTKAAGEKKVNGRDADPGWVSRATNALKFKRYYVTQMQRRARGLRDRKRSEQGRIPTSVEMAFMQAAREMLVPELYESLVERAKNLTERRGV